MTVAQLEQTFKTKSKKEHFLCLKFEDTLALLAQATKADFAVTELYNYRPSKAADFDFHEAYTSEYSNLETDWNEYVKLNNEYIFQKIQELKKDTNNQVFYLEIIDNQTHLENLEAEKTVLELLALLKKHKPQKNALLEVIAAEVTDQMLDHISKADYGWESEICYPILKEIQQTKTTPLKTEFIVGETLSLTQWEEPKTTEKHIRRLFCSTTLMMLYPTDGISIGYNEVAPLAAFYESVAVLDKKYHKAALALLAWRILYDNEHEYESSIDSLLNSTTTTFYIYTLLLLLILNKEAEDEIKPVVKLLLKMDKNERDDGFFIENDTFLLGLTNHQQRHDVWKTNTQKMLNQIDYISDVDLKETLQKIGKAIIESKGLDK